MKISTIGLDLAKTWFQVHGVDVAGTVIVRRRLRRGEVLAYFQSIEPCLVGMEACATAHHWARELMGARADRARPSGEADATGLCEGIRQAEQE